MGGSRADRAKASFLIYQREGGGGLHVWCFWLNDYEVIERTTSAGAPPGSSTTTYLGPAPRQFLELRHAELRAYGYTLIATRSARAPGAGSLISGEQ